MDRNRLSFFSERFAGYNLTAFRNDLSAGVIVGVIAIPLGMAFAIASGVHPQYGIYTTIIAGALISLFGGSRYQIGGPTGAFIPILLAIVLQYGYENLLIAGMMAGVMLIVMGLCKLGDLIAFIPKPVTIGFTSGIALIIFSGQIANFLGLTDVERHPDLLSNLAAIIANLHAVNVYSIVTALVCLLVLALVPRILPGVPAALPALLVATGVALLFGDSVATIGSAYGAIPNSLPAFAIPALSWERVQRLLLPAFTIAMLGGIESLLSAVVADGMTGTRHNSNRELIGQGIANLVAPMFGGIPATGAIARTATNIESGAVSPLSGVIHSLVVLLVLLLFAPFAAHIPLAAMAPVLMAVAWNMSERKTFLRILRAWDSDALVLAATFLFTVLTDLTTAVLVGLLLAALLFVKRMVDATAVVKVLPDRQARNNRVRPQAVTRDRDCPQFSIVTVEGPLFFGAADRFEQRVEAAIHDRPGILLLRMSRVPLIDATGEAALRRVVNRFRRQDGLLLLSGLQPQPRMQLQRSGILTKIGTEHCFDHTGEAIHFALGRLDYEACLGCRRFAFHECRALSGGTFSA